MKIDVQDVSSVKKVFRIEIPVEDVNAEFERAYEDVRKNIDVPGFRKGRAPRNIIKMRFGEYIKTDVVEKLIPSAYQKAIEDSNLEVIGSPDINPPSENILFSIETDIIAELDKGNIPEALKAKFQEKDISISDNLDFTIDKAGEKWTLKEGRKTYILSKEDDKINVRIDELHAEEDKPFIFEIAVNIKPKIKIPDYSLLEIEKGDVNVTQDDVNEYIERLRDSRASFEPIEGRPIQDGDYAHFILKVTQDDEVLEDTEDSTLEIKKDSLISEVYENVLGMNIGDEKEFTVNLPEDYENKKLAGKETKFYMKLISNTEKHLPNLDDDFAKDMNEESLEKLTGKIWNYLVDIKRKQKREEIEGELISQLIDKTDFEVSDSLIEAQVKRFIRGQNNLSEEDIASYRSLSERMIKRMWIMDAIADKEGIEVSEEEVEAEVYSMAMARNKDPQKYMSQLKATNRIEEIKDSIRDKKIFDILIEKASEKKTLIV